MGQDIAEYGGVFKVTEGLIEKYGKERVFNTPLCESAILSTAYGLSVGGYKSRRNGGRIINISSI